jgi:hypothetical protein
MTKDERKHERETASGRLSVLLRSDPELSFVVGVLKKMAGFFVIALSAVGIEKIVDVLKAHHASELAILLLNLLAGAILIVDAVWFTIYLVIEALESIATLLKGKASKVAIAATLVILGAIASPYLKTWLAALIQTIASQSR